MLAGLAVAEIKIDVLKLSVNAIEGVPLFQKTFVVFMSKQKYAVYNTFILQQS